MKELTGYLLISILAGMSWMVLAIIHFINSGDETFLELGVVMFALIYSIMSILFVKLYYDEHPNLNDVKERK